MSKKMSFVLVALLLIGILALTFHTHLSNASGTIYIRADGSIEPSYANIVTTDNITYSFTGNNYDAIWVERSNIVIDGNGYTLQRIGGSGFYIVNVNNITIKNTNIDGCDIYFLWSSNNSILANNLTNGGGITLSSSSNNNISGNMITNCSKGIDLTLSNYNIISQNNITANSRWGINLFQSSNNNIFGNNVTNNEYGIYFYSSSNNLLRNNVMANNSYNFGVQATSLATFINDIDISNTVNGKSIYYWVNRQDDVVPLDAGYVALINSTRIRVENLTLTQNSWGIQCAYTVNSTITANTIASNRYGIDLRFSSNNTVSENSIIANDMDGLTISSSSDNNISRNTIVSNVAHGIWLSWSSGNRIIGNSITTNNGYGIRVWEASYNFLYHNNFVHNNVQVIMKDSVNAWDDGYPSGGNYWSNYTGTDADGDGIGDTPHIISSTEQDNYPLIGPWTNAGENITITHASNVSLTFANVTSGGITTVNSTSMGPAPPSGFKLASDPPIYYDIKTTAQYSGTIELIIPYSDTDLMEEEENGLKLMYWNETLQQWIDITTYVDIENNIIYGETTSLSVFTFMAPFIHNLAVTAITPHKTSIGQGYSLTINVTVKNWDYAEIFNITLYCNNTAITLPDGKNYTTITIPVGTLMSISLIWNTTGFAKSNYSLSAYAWPVLGETYTVDNTLFDGWVLVTFPGDVDGDRDVDIFDIVQMAGTYNKQEGDPAYDPNSDIDGDGDIDIFDIVLAARNYNKSW